MFTGIVETMGRVAEAVDLDTTRRFRFEAAGLEGALEPGDSVAVDGACLTVVEAAGKTFGVDVIGTTLERTIAGRYRSGTKVNLERAMVLGARLDGHLVQGHVDGVGRISRIAPAPGQHTFRFQVDERLGGMMIEKGSVAIDGISLTVAGLDGNSFSVAIIPHTLEATTLGEKRVGDRVNVEADLVGKWVRRLLEGSREGITLEKLREAGFA